VSDIFAELPGYLQHPWNIGSYYLFLQIRYQNGLEKWQFLLVGDAISEEYDPDYAGIDTGFPVN